MRLVPDPLSPGTPRRVNDTNRAMPLEWVHRNANCAVDQCGTAFNPCVGRSINGSRGVAASLDVSQRGLLLMRGSDRPVHFNSAPLAHIP